MPLVGAGQFISILRAYRICWIAGRFGGHKTSMAVKLAEEFLREGYRLATNLDCVWADDLESIQPLQDHQLKVVVVADEAGLEVKHKSQVEAITAYARKMDIIYLYPSFFPPTKSAQVVTLQTMFGFQPIGIPVVLYSWKVSLGNFTEKGSFFWVKPSEVYGLYSSNNPGAKLDKLMSWLASQGKGYRQKFYADEQQDGVLPLVSYEEHANEELEELTERIEQAADVISLSDRKGRRNRS